jgi:NTP pyrophosphatase (non-canonical NTP hydrolase)
MTTRAAQEFSRLIEIMATLRGPDGCPWDREQTIDSLKPFVLEETYEVLEATIGNDHEVCGGARRLIFEAVLAQLEAEAGFEIADSLKQVADKLVWRHPHRPSRGIRASRLNSAARFVRRGDRRRNGQTERDRLTGRRRRQRAAGRRAEGRKGGRGRWAERREGKARNSSEPLRTPGGIAPTPPPAPLRSYHTQPRAARSGSTGRAPRMSSRKSRKRSTNCEVVETLGATPDPARA